MASFRHLSLFFFVILYFHNHAAIAAGTKPKFVLLSVKKDTNTLQYYTSVGVGTPSFPVDAVIDISTGYLWFDCESGFTTSTYKNVPCESLTCELARGSGCLGCNGPARPGCANNTCPVSPFNPFIGRLLAAGLYEDVLRIGSTQVPNFPFACVDKDQLPGLVAGAEGVLGLSRLVTALPIQISNTLNVPPMFSLCLPSSGLGKLAAGDLTGNKDRAKFLLSTPLIVNKKSTGPVIVQGQESEEYFIGVKGIKISGKDVSFNKNLLTFDKNGNGGTKFSTLTNFTRLHTSIFRAVVNEFSNKAASMGISRVAAVRPFGACFSSKTIKNTKTGPAVPEIELVLTNGVSWKIYGANSMVRVNENVLCLGFVDGGPTSTTVFPSTSIVIGGKQIEDNYVEFDTSTSTVKFSSSLLVHDRTCATF